jgi:hypothetical protein
LAKLVAATDAEVFLGKALLVAMLYFYKDCLVLDSLL